ncbi:hypothetical protein PAXRUDRAFT_28461 [Paxillus rubicundulus Ve08.2h10]|uniref:Uncharacterized protein n=1 Tax=Paxillus rubicundulus Ve08.2h10 TaxID=930991 RepID=A0A0D0CUR4_9AGAM|nr:hypothetical protein PAXRUDRAFT_28461 [Paxillus rubicundulus Ve08.2h10]
MLGLLASSHLSDIPSAINVPQPKTKLKEPLSSNIMKGVITFCAAADEHMMVSIADHFIDVNKVLASMANNGIKMHMKLLKVLNKSTGIETPGQFMFLVTNWGSEVAAKKVSLDAKGPQLSMG